jgi:aconitate hydratase
VYFLTPDVVGVNLTGKAREGVTATDIVLTVTEMLRKAKVVGKFVEFFGEGTASLAVPDRATIANMAPEYGATMGFFPVDEKTIDYFRSTGRSAETLAALESYFRAQGLFGIPMKGDIDYTDVLELDIGTVRASVAGPKRPQDRIDLGSLKSKFTSLFSEPVAKNGFAKKPEDLATRFTTKDGVNVGNGDVLIAAITSCTNTSNPSVLIAAGLLAKESGRARPHGEAAHQDLARARIARGDRLPHGIGPPAVPREARLLRLWLRLHHLHRQRRPARRADRASGRSRRTSCARPCFPATAISKRASTRTSARTSWRRPRSSSPTRSAGSVLKDLEKEPLGQGKDGPVFFARRVAHERGSGRAPALRARPGLSSTPLRRRRRRTIPSGRRSLDDRARCYNWPKSRTSRNRPSSKPSA